MSAPIGITLGEAVMAFVENIRREYGEDVTVGTVVIVCDLVVDAEVGHINPVVTYCNDARKWVQAALLHEGSDIADDANLQREYEAAGDEVDD